jgi:diadenosine tetraphosphate (Ap4A) HIT family hydrolase
VVRATAHEQHVLLALVAVFRKDLDPSAAKPHGYSVGLDVGAVAGQWVMPLHWV